MRISHFPSIMGQCSRFVNGRVVTFDDSIWEKSLKWRQSIQYAFFLNSPFEVSAVYHLDNISFIWGIMLGLAMFMFRNTPLRDVVTYLAGMVSGYVYHYLARRVYWMTAGLCVGYFCCAGIFNMAACIRLAVLWVLGPCYHALHWLVRRLLWNCASVQRAIQSFNRAFAQPRPVGSPLERQQENLVLLGMYWDHRCVQQYRYMDRETGEVFDIPVHRN